MSEKIDKYSKWLITMALGLFVLSALTFFSPKLTPPGNLGSMKKTTVSETLADLSYFSFFAGALLNLISSFRKKEKE